MKRRPSSRWSQRIPGATLPPYIYRNALVSMFLQELEYYQEIMFLTTNWVKQFDDAIASKIHLSLKYESLGLIVKRDI